MICDASPPKLGNHAFVWMVAAFCLSPCGESDCSDVLITFVWRHAAEDADGVATVGALVGPLGGNPRRMGPHVVRTARSALQDLGSLELSDEVLEE